MYRLMPDAGSIGLSRVEWSNGQINEGVDDFLDNAGFKQDDIERESIRMRE